MLDESSLAQWGRLSSRDPLQPYATRPLTRTCFLDRSGNRYPTYSHFYPSDTYVRLTLVEWRNRNGP